VRRSRLIPLVASAVVVTSAAHAPHSHPGPTASDAPPGTDQNHTSPAGGPPTATHTPNSHPPSSSCPDDAPQPSQAHAPDSPSNTPATSPAPPPGPPHTGADHGTATDTLTHRTTTTPDAPAPALAAARRDRRAFKPCAPGDPAPTASGRRRTRDTRPHCQTGEVPPATVFAVAVGETGGATDYTSPSRFRQTWQPPTRADGPLGSATRCSGSPRQPKSERCSRSRDPPHLSRTSRLARLGTARRGN
jgi:hypothetical protein